MSQLRNLFRLIYPALCPGCGEPLLPDEHDLCLKCQFALPFTHFSTTPFNSAEQRLTGRFPLHAVTSYLYFNQQTLGRPIVHSIKYNGNIHLARTMGRHMGLDLLQSDRFSDIDLIVPVPLHWRKFLQRGYNQSEELSRGIAQVLHLPISTRNLVRTTYTETQTHKDRSQRLSNMQHVFRVKHPEEFQGKHLLVIDDVITTGATIDAACQPLSTIPDITISIATLCIAGHY